MSHRELEPSSFPQKQLHQPMNWKIAECAAVGASVIGACASVISAQIAYVAAPVSLSLCLNLLNRDRWEKQSRALSLIISQNSHRIQEIEQSGANLSEKPLDATAAWQAIQDLQDLTNGRLDKLMRELSQIHLRLSQISTQAAELERENRYHQRLMGDRSSKYHLTNGKDPNSSLLKDVQNRLAKIEELDLITQYATLEKLQAAIASHYLNVEQRCQAQESLIAEIQERLSCLEGLEVENQLLEVLQVHLRLYKWQQELTAEINQRLTPVVVEMKLGKQRQLALETKIAKLGIVDGHASVPSTKNQENLVIN